MKGISLRTAEEKQALVAFLRSRSGIVIECLEDAGRMQARDRTLTQSLSESDAVPL
jgi:hypothetical protein